ncbi:MAG: histidine phosphatase family protein, partial [Myxococcota bacterium]
MSILLIRHGETASNAARIVQTPEIPLSPHGLGQARRLAARLAGMGVAAILSSDLARAAMTAEQVQAATEAPLSFDADLQERNYGDVRGQTYAALGVNILAPDYEPPGGETWVEFHARVDRAWATVVRLHAATPGNLAVVTHGLVCHAIAARHLHLPDGASAAGGWHNASLTVVEAGLPSGRWTVEALNCITHLRDGEAGSAGAPPSRSGGA